MNSTSVIRRTLSAARRALVPAFTSIRFLVLLMIPVSLFMFLLERSGLLGMVASLLDPLMRLTGLPGEAALIFISSMALNLYSAIAVIGTLSLSTRELCIIASMCLIAHSLVIECSIMKKTGSSALKMALIRITTALVTGFLLNLLLPGVIMSVPGILNPQAAGGAGNSFMAALLAWAKDSGLLILRVALIVTVLMVLHEILEEFGILAFLGKLTGPFMMLLGLPANSGFLWIVANTVGLSFGSAVLIEQTESGKISYSDSDLFNHHAGISHSLLEDTLLFAAIGVPLFWALLPRFFMAVFIVWIERGRRGIFKRSFRIGIV